MYKVVNEIIKEKVRPLLMEHYGDIELLSVENNCVTVKFLGACKGCPSAQETLQEIVLANIQQEIPQITEVILDQETSPELLALAKLILNGQKPDQTESKHQGGTP